MKPPWLQQGGDAELEALQTDIMRFVAILGLCLAAIFSLVHSAVPPPAAPPPKSAQPAPKTVQTPVKRGAVFDRPKPAQPKMPVSAAQPYQTSTPASQPQASPAGAEAGGFTLEFESDDALLRLLAEGAVGLYARVGGQLWELRGASGAFARASAAPRSYYVMLAGTVPADLRGRLAGVTGATAEEWGVRLSAGVTRQLDTIMRERAGGTLLIRGDGSVNVEAP